MSYTEFLIEGDVNISVKVTDLGNGDFQFDVAVVTEGADYTGQIGELNGFWFNLPDDTDYSALSVSGVEEYQLAADDVNKLDGGVNLNGTVLKENGGEFDAGMLIDATGLGNGETLSTSFVLSDASGNLTLEDFTTMADFEQFFGVRLTSVGEPDGARNGSLKLGDYPSDEIIGDPEPDVHVAEDDVLKLGFDPLSGDYFVIDLEANVLANDTTNGTDPYSGGFDTLVLAGSNGGVLTINADGTVLFDDTGFGPSPFDPNPITTFTYEVEGGDTATVTVCVDDGGVA